MKRRVIRKGRLDTSALGDVVVPSGSAIRASLAAEPDTNIFDDEAVSAVSASLRNRTNKTAVASSDTAGVAFLPEAEGSGAWQFLNADYSSQVAIDTRSMFYIPPSSDLTGASGAWVRQWDEKVANAHWAGVSTWDDALEAISIQSQLFPNTELRIGAGTYQKTSASTSVIASITVRGAGSGKTIVQQAITAVTALVDFDRSAAHPTAGQASLIGVTLDGNDLNTGIVLTGLGCDDVELSDVEIIGWRSAVQFQSRGTSESVDPGRQCKNITARKLRCHSPSSTLGQGYPIQINSPWGTEQIENVDFEDVVVEGVGGWYLSTTTSGTADQITFQNVNGVRLKNITSSDGGEININFSRGTRNVIAEDITTFGADADGVNVGSGQIIVTPASTADFVIDETVTINGDITGNLDTIYDGQLYITGVTTVSGTEMVSVGHTITGAVASTTISDWRGGAHDVHLRNVRSYGNGRDENSTGNSYTGIRINLATSVTINDCDLSETTNPAVQSYGLQIVNGVDIEYSGLNCAGNLIEEVNVSGLSRAARLNTNIAPRTMHLAKGPNVTIASGVAEIGDAGWQRLTPESGDYDELTDIVAEPGSTLSDGQVVVLSTSSTARRIRLTPSSRLRVSPRVLAALYDTVTLIYSTSGVGIWHEMGQVQYGSESTSVTTVENTTTETTLYSESIEARTLGRAKLALYGYLVNTSGADCTFTLRVKFGATTLYEDVTGNIISGAQTRPVAIELLLASVGDTQDAQRLFGKVILGANGAATSGDGDLGTDEINSNAVIRGSSTEATTSSLAFAVTVQPSVADTGIQFVSEYSMLDISR